MMTLSYMKNEADAEDIAQEAFLNALFWVTGGRSRLRQWNERRSARS